MALFGVNIAQLVETLVLKKVMCKNSLCSRGKY